MKRSANLPIIVIPDGLAANLQEPNFIFRTVLEYVCKEHPYAKVYLAPANTFGGPLYEQEAAAIFLKQQKYAGEVITVPSTGTKYIDTRGNAKQLKAFLKMQNRWPMGPIILVVGSKHLRRSILCFRKEGFVIHEAIGVPYSIPRDECTVWRLWHCKYGPVHSLYEFLAWVRDFVRP